MRAALYARVSTRDQGQDPELQLYPLRNYVASRGWELAEEFVDLVSASDFPRRHDWQRLLDAARRRQLDVIAVWKLDRAWRSTVECLNQLQDWEARGVKFVCVSQPELDTTTPMGRLLITVMAAVAEFERDLTRERIREGIANAKRKGLRLGRPKVSERAGFEDLWAAVRDRVLAGVMSKREACRELGIGFGTLARLLEEVAP